MSCLVAGAKMDDVEPIKLLPNTQYTFGNEEVQGDNCFTIASEAVVDAEHARIETGKFLLCTCC